MGIIIEGAEVGIVTGSASTNVGFIGNLTQCLGLSEQKELINMSKLTRKSILGSDSLMKES